MLLRKNRIALARGAVAAVPSGQDDVAAYDVPLACVVHAHPHCSIQWSWLLIDLSPTEGARISDMAPREVADDHPVELTTTVGVGLKFEILAKTLSAELKPEVTAKARSISRRSCRPAPASLAATGTSSPLAAASHTSTGTCGCSSRRRPGSRSPPG